MKSSIKFLAGIIPLALFALGCSPPMHSPKDTVLIQSCYDGDTCTTSNGEKIRLACIDTPELKGPRANPVSAKAARDYLRSRVVGKNLRIVRISKDRYGRTVGDLYLGDSDSVGADLVRSGHAVIYDKYAGQCIWSARYPNAT